jgi:hypothetical protein
VDSFPDGHPNTLPLQKSASVDGWDVGAGAGVGGATGAGGSIKGFSASTSNEGAGSVCCPKLDKTLFSSSNTW